MTSNANGTGASAALARAGVVVPWAIGLAAFGYLSPSAPVAGLLFVVLGIAAATLTAFQARELGRAMRSSAIFWESTARNAWLIGVLAAEVAFTRALSDSSRGIAEVARGMVLAFLPALYGLALGGLAAVPALRMRATGTESRPNEAGAGTDRWFGVALFVVLVAWAVMRSPVGGAWRFAPWATLLHWPAVLVVIGGALLVVAIAGEGLRRRIGVVALALAGTFASLAGLVLLLLGFADQSIARVVSGLSFILTSCFVALAGMLTVANPIEDRRLREGGEPFPVNRTAWLLLPAATLVFLVIALVLAMTPMQQKM
jgi:hypothetical protein